MELLNYAYADRLEGLDPKQRSYVIAALEGRLGPNGGFIVDDPTLPTYGQEAPAWYGEGTEDPFSDTFSVG